MPRPLSSPRARASLAVLAAAIATAVLHLFPPWLYPIYPVCPLRALTGWRCPGCGSTHALAALLCGRLADAFQYNPLAALLWPVLGALALAEVYSALQWNRWLQLRHFEPRDLITR